MKPAFLLPQTIFALLLTGIFASPAVCQLLEPANPPGPDILLREFRPESTLVVPETKLAHAAFPAIDLHTHFRLRMREATPEDLGKYVREVLDPNQIAVCV
ncbi:MAG: hypothetical protein ACKO0N_03525, partial [Planctomycetota bacterium]